ncbi:hypothetical protein OOU_Y34scaffold00619g40 [Pyricularia oryzae Y34]|uniref:Hydrophobin n=2 Tax=Pyricularia oryzae TaxID=318829 RepID=A0AA97PJK6_PYRO3|nr:hypothetical protein OOU_Y34scaffold00619g40 [Pyricularia oryzae Y34]
MLACFLFYIAALATGVASHGAAAGDIWPELVARQDPCAGNDGVVCCQANANDLCAQSGSQGKEYVICITDGSQGCDIVLGAEGRPDKDVFARPCCWRRLGSSRRFLQRIWGAEAGAECVKGVACGVAEESEESERGDERMPKVASKTYSSKRNYKRGRYLRCHDYYQAYLSPVTTTHRSPARNRPRGEPDSEGDRASITRNKSGFLTSVWELEAGSSWKPRFIFGLEFLAFSIM